MDESHLNAPPDCGRVGPVYDQAAAAALRPSVSPCASPGRVYDLKSGGAQRLGGASGGGRRLLCAPSAYSSVCSG